MTIVHETRLKGETKRTERCIFGHAQKYFVDNSKKGGELLHLVSDLQKFYHSAGIPGLFGLYIS